MMTYFLLFASLLLGTWAGMPEFSWDTPPVFVHMCQTSGPFNSSQLAYLARYPIVTIEKAQGLDTGKPVEYEIELAAAQIKAANPKAYVVMYHNLVLDWAFYEAHQTMLEHPSWWLRDKNGDVVYRHGDTNFPNHTKILVFDLSQKVVQDFWISVVMNRTKAGNIDGIFGDRGCGGDSGANLTPEKAIAYRKGFYDTITRAQQALGPNGLFIDNCLGFECEDTGQCPLPGVKGMMRAIFCKDLTGEAGKVATTCIDDIELIQSFNNRSDLVVEVRFGRSQLKNSTDVELPLAAFLIAASEYTYFGMSDGWFYDGWDIWWPAYSRKLGPPNGMAVRKDNVFTRSFEHAHVTFDAEKQTSKIEWLS